MEPTPFSRRWYSHKFKGPGVRYEVALCIQTGDIVWINGPYACGSWADIRIFRHVLIHHLGEGEMVEADRGYRGEPGYIRTAEAAVSIADSSASFRARARQETVNGRFKNWKILSTRFRHPIQKHVHAFSAVAAITQIGINMGESLFQLRY
jgi:hypothetical protein